MSANLACEVHEGTGPYLLLVHGMLASRSQSLPNLEALAKFCTPVTIELFGHNQSPSPDEPEAYLPRNYVKLFDQIRARLNVERWFVCGFSLGAALTIRYAFERPDRCIGQIFTNSNSAFADQKTQAMWLSGSKRSAKAIRRGGLSTLERMPHHPRHARRIPKDAKEALVADSRNHSPKGIALTTEYTNPNAPVREAVKKNQVPSLFLFGKYEKRFQQHRPYIEQEMPLLDLVECEAGHPVNMQAAETFNEAVREFVQRLA